MIGSIDVFASPSPSTLDFIPSIRSTYRTIVQHQPVHAHSLSNVELPPTRASMADPENRTAIFKIDASDYLEGPPPSFGHAMLEYFSLDPGFINLDHGLSPFPLPCQIILHVLQVPLVLCRPLCRERAQCWPTISRLIQTNSYGWSIIISYCLCVSGWHPSWAQKQMNVFSSRTRVLRLQ